MAATCTFYDSVRAIARPAACGREKSDIAFPLQPVRSPAIAHQSKANPSVIRRRRSSPLTRGGTLHVWARSSSSAAKCGDSLSEAREDLHEHALVMDQQAAAAWRKVVAHDVRSGGTVRMATVDELAHPDLAADHSLLSGEEHPCVTLSVDARQKPTPRTSSALGQRSPGTSATGPSP